MNVHPDIPTADPMTVRHGTTVLSLPHPPGIPGTSTPSPMSGRVGVGIESLSVGDFIISHNAQSHRILQTIRSHYIGTMIGISCDGQDIVSWSTPGHRILCALRTTTYGAERSWDHILPGNFERARRLRYRSTHAEKELWNLLRGKQLGVKFRRQHPVGRYIPDFYSWEAGIVVEADGEIHNSDESREYDYKRDSYLRSLGLTVLRFSNNDILMHSEQVVRKITESIHQAEPSENHYRQWRRVDSLRVGDSIFVDQLEHPYPITTLFTEEVDEEITGLVVEEAHSFTTTSCIAHDCCNIVP